ncbi:MAG: hypothetical protein HY897_11535 [Deltaproteobacteria bacterium]|nr:hypothetical protein [Deltaproteobacteria bacterium]
MKIASLSVVALAALVGLAVVSCGGDEGSADAAGGGDGGGGGGQDDGGGQDGGGVEDGGGGSLSLGAGACRELLAAEDLNSTCSNIPDGQAYSQTNDLAPAIYGNPMCGVEFGGGHPGILRL